MFYEKTDMTLDRMRQLEAAAERDIVVLEEMLTKP